jgi:hypothetical protein
MNARARGIAPAKEPRPDRKEQYQRSVKRSVAIRPIRVIRVPFLYVRIIQQLFVEICVIRGKKSFTECTCTFPPSYCIPVGLELANFDYICRSMRSL